MPLYETVLIARNDVSQAQVETLIENITSLLGEHGGSVRKREFWGLRTLAYRIKKNRKGHYVLLGIEAPIDAMNEMGRQLSLNEDVLRVLTLRVDEIDDTPSPILSRKGDDRGDRGSRGGRGGRYESGRNRRHNNDSSSSETRENTAAAE
ncbi:MULTISPECIES: 30S ribosomal protein S6 [unclassified Saccharibacter]|uniref:30S ribosomal protein S6 n=1 Tax=unclassified Saccharibacter TaxID=2648722 RepID=UPI0013282110|nr:MULTISPECIES: 30S ribosomal protein S6 [unclassified Saccharibacter]MXV35019.1 30S ribosomal protein S6 [Saccharibacter sp. EH611]MXV57434.1 30S ribosomal protein S6 [Saccharibacter sp. EH70]MXV64705.1 30S ribosomal protein S6 [Saccharibacter sp. EH60]